MVDKEFEFSFWRIKYRPRHFQVQFNKWRISITSIWYDRKRWGWRRDRHPMRLNELFEVYFGIFRICIAW